MAGDHIGLNAKLARVKILLQHFYNDHRQKAFVVVNKSWQTVNDLQLHIQKMFHIATDIYITVDDDCLLPADEHISILNPMDHITVHPANPFTQLAAALAHAHINSAIESTPNVDEMSSPGFSKRKKKRFDDSGFGVEGAESIPVSVKRSNWIDDVNLLNESIEVESIAAPLGAGSEKIKRKRLRKRKVKTTLESPVEPISLYAPQPRVPISFAKCFVAQQSAFKKPTAPPAGHLRFEDKSNSDDDSITEPEPVQSNEYPIKARVIRAKVVKAEPKSPSSAGQEQTAIVEPIVSTVAKDVPIDDTKVGGVGEQQATEATPPSSVELLRKNLHNMELTSAVGNIKTNDVIAFKMYKMGINYMPELSEYIVGIVLDMSNEEEVTISVLAGFEQTIEPNGRFSMHTDEVDPQPVSGVGTLNMRLADILQAKYVTLNV